MSNSPFRGRALPAVALCVAMAATACGSDGDPLATRCAQACQVAAPDPCAKGTFESQCVADCRALAGEAAALRNAECGSCIAGLFEYSGKRCRNDQLCTFFGDQETCEGAGCSQEVEVCFGAKRPNLADPGCETECAPED